MRVVCLADAPLLVRGAGRGAGSDAVPLVLDPASDDALRQVLAAAAENPLLVLLPTRDRHRSALLTHLVATALDAPVVSVEVRLPPLGLSVLAERLQTAAVGRSDVDVLAAAAPVVAGEMQCSAVLGSVSGLDRIPTTLKQHARSWLPGSRFVVRATGRPLVLPAGDAGAAPLLVPSSDQVVVTSAAERGDGVWVDEQLSTVPGSRRLSATSGAGSAVWWGTDRLVEVVHAPMSSPVLEPEWLPAGSSVCDWCEGLAVDGRCLVCGGLAGPPPGDAVGASSGPAARRAGAASPSPFDVRSTT